MNVIGLPEQHAAVQDYDVWPEHEEVVAIFLSCCDQWRTGPNGVIGLDLNVAFQFCDLYNVKDRLQLMADLRIISARARELINSNQRN